MSAASVDRAVVEQREKRRRRFAWMTVEDYRLLLELDAAGMPAAADEMEALIRSQADLPDERDHREHEILECDLALHSSIDSIVCARVARWSHGAGGGRRRRPRELARG